MSATSIIAAACCCLTQCSSCPACHCFLEDPLIVSVPAFNFVGISSVTSPAIVSVHLPDMMFELQNGECGTALPIVPCNTGASHIGPVAGASATVDGIRVASLSFNIAVCLFCYECDCVAYWHLAYKFDVFGDIGDGVQLLFESWYLVSPRLVPPFVGGGECSSAQTPEGDYFNWYYSLQAVCPWLSSHVLCSNVLPPPNGPVDCQEFFAEVIL